jgi:predicted DCC family thiol-disulfide oxidoreductase YuxK
MEQANMSPKSTMKPKLQHTDSTVIADRQAPDAVVATVFYDGGCPLCRREIHHYRRLRGAEHLIWVDLSTDDRMLAVHGLERQAAMARFHVLDASGRWQTGAWAFIELWSHLPAYRWLAYLLRALHLEKILDWVYTRFARWRLQRRCDTASCSR